MDIDVVFSGGGIKGLALIGAYEVLEQKGYRFKRIAGTSVGSILAGLVAAGYSSSEIETLLNETELKEFLDSRNVLLPMPIAKWLLLYWRMGLYKGHVFEEWLEKKLAAKGVYTFSDLPPNSFYVVASDLTNGRLLVLPDDLEDYGIPKETFPVARAIRMSSSLPYFFEPIKLRSLSGINTIVDGGVLSNFPMWIFVKEGEMKIRPVLGITLSSSQRERPKRVIKNAIQLFEALFITMKEAHDSRYISRKHEKDVVFISIKEDLTTEFTITQEKKDALIEIGRMKTSEFLKTWTF